MQRTDQFEDLQVAIRQRMERRHLASALAVASAIWTAQMKFGFLEESHGEIAERSGRSSATVCAILGRLEKVGLLTVTRSRYRTVHRYVVHPPQASSTRPQTPASATRRPFELEKPAGVSPASRAAGIRAEIKELQTQTYEEKGGLLRLLPAAKAKIATLRTELSALEISSPTTTPKQTGNDDEKEKNAS